MNKLKRFGRCFARKSVGALLFVGKHPMETIELLSASFLLVFALYTMIPMQITAQTPTAYDNDLIKIVFGMLMGAPSVFLLSARFSGSMEDYIYQKQRSRRRTLFWIAFTWFYISMLRAVAIAWLPPIFLAFLLPSLVTIICYIRLGN